MEPKVPHRLGETFRELKVFEGNRKSFEVNVFAVANYVEESSYWATAGKVSGFLDSISSQPCSAR